MCTHTHTEKSSSAEEQCWANPNMKTDMSTEFSNMEVNGKFMDKNLGSLMCNDMSIRVAKEKSWVQNFKEMS